MRRSLRALLLVLLAASAVVSQGQLLEVVAGDEAAAPARAAVEDLARGALARLLPSFPGLAGDGIRIVVHADAERVPEPLREHLHPGTAGFALLGQNEAHVILEAARSRPPHDLAAVVGHELTHVLLDRWAGRAGPFVSRWFHEGLAQELSGGRYLGVSEEQIAFRAATNRLLSFRDLHARFPDEPAPLSAAYAQSWSYVAFLRRRYGLELLLRAAQDSRAGSTYAEAFARVVGEPLPEDEWRHWLVHGSGAGPRVLLENCFALLLLVSLPLLALAGIRLWNREHRKSVELERREAEEEQRL